MSSLPAGVLDASALLAFVQDEPGAGAVEEALNQTAIISIVNWIEVLSKLSDLGVEPAVAMARLAEKGILQGDLNIAPLSEELALEMVRLRPLTKHLGLSLGDRACLGLGRLLRLPVLTADRTWSLLSLGMPVKQIR